jgi:hypothetical protein
MFLVPTSESQGHGKSWEIEILTRLGIPIDILKSYKQTDIYDGKKEHIQNNRNVSIKTTKSMTLDCGDIIRFLTSCSELDIIVISYEQKMKKVKKAKNTYLINHDLLIEKLKEDIPKIYNITFEIWIDKIEEYVKQVKSIKHGKCTNKWYKKAKEQLCKDIPYFNIAPKVDSKSQRRVQCSINLKKINIDETYDGGKFKDITYMKEIISEPRKKQMNKNSERMKVTDIKFMYKSMESYN